MHELCNDNNGKKNVHSMWIENSKNVFTQNLKRAFKRIWYIFYEKYLYGKSVTTKSSKTGFNAIFLPSFFTEKKLNVWNLTNFRHSNIVHYIYSLTNNNTYKKIIMIFTIFRKHFFQSQIAIQINSIQKNPYAQMYKSQNIYEKWHKNETFFFIIVVGVFKFEAS